MRGERHGARDRRQDEQHQELLEQKQLDAPIGRQLVLGAHHGAQTLKTRIVAERLAGGGWNADDHRERDREGENRDHRHGNERGAITAQVQELFGEERAHASHLSARGSGGAVRPWSLTRCRYTSSSAGISWRTSRISPPAPTSADTRAGMRPSSII